MKRYNPKEIETKWQDKWEADKIYQAVDDLKKPKKYVLEYFPYPSGAAMHVGHVRNYTIGDAMARFARMRGYNVLHPMGWDAFGLPAENYAIKNKVSPRSAINKNTDRFKRQLKQMGFSYDWSREIDSTVPGYYRWTQWFFLLLFKLNLAYQKESLQWWCPFDKTVLANEQVENGLCWRCGNKVEKKSLKQWFFKITDYADRLLDDLDDLDWSDAIKSMQRNWIGRSVGAEIKFRIDGPDECITVFTTRPDTLFGATFLVISPEHPLALQITSTGQREEVEKYIKAAASKSDIERQETNREKTGVFSGAYAINPVNDKKVPIWIADYVLYGYGTGAIMAVPAHDKRDYDFAEKFDLPIVDVIAPELSGTGINRHRDDVETLERRVVAAILCNDKGEYLLLVEPDNTHFLGGDVELSDADDVAALKRQVTEESGYTDFASIKPVSSTIVMEGYRIPKGKNQRTEGVFYEVVLASDKRVASEVEEGKHEIKWVPKSEVAKQLTFEHHSLAWEQYVTGNRCYEGEGVLVNSGTYDGLSAAEARDKIIADLETKGFAKERVNYKIRDWLISRQRYWGAPIPIIHCSKDGAVAVPEDQLPVLLPEITDYEPSGDGRSPLAKIAEFINTDCPKCGGPAKRETDTMDGFACSSWYFLRFADPHNNSKPFDKDKADLWLPVDDYIGGAEHAVMHLLYARFWTKVMFDQGLIDFKEPFSALRNQGMILAPDGQKMSKSRGNTIEPDGLIEQGYGADSVRIMELFIGPWNQAVNWSVEGMAGAYRFLQRVWNLTQEFLEAKEEQNAKHNPEVSRELNRITHRTIKKVGDDLNALSYNTAIASQMEMINDLYKQKTLDLFADREAWEFSINSLLQLLAPFAPHISEELWHQMGNTTSIHLSQWPAVDEQYLKLDQMSIAIQINGKLRGEIKVNAAASEETVVEAAKAEEKVAALLTGHEIKKTIYVSQHLVNFVI